MNILLTSGKKKLKGHLHCGTTSVGDREVTTRGLNVKDRVGVYRILAGQFHSDDRQNAGGTLAPAS